MKKLLILSTSAVTLALSSPVLASDDDAYCGKTEGQPMQLEAVKAKVAEKGYEVRRIKREDGCLEVYAIDKNRARVELYVNPVSGVIVKTENGS